MINQVKPEVPALLPCHVPGEKCADVNCAFHKGLNVSLFLFLLSLSLGKG